MDQKNIGNNNEPITGCQKHEDGQSSGTIDILKPDPNRYSPENTNGKKCYPIEFLLAVCKYQCSDLPDPLPKFPERPSRIVPREKVNRRMSSNSVDADYNVIDLVKVVDSSLTLDTITLGPSPNPWKSSRSMITTVNDNKEVRKLVTSRRLAANFSCENQSSYPSSGGSSLSSLMRRSSMGADLRLNSLVRPFKTNDNEDRKLTIDRTIEDTKSLASHSSWSFRSQRLIPQTISSTSSKNGPSYASALSAAPSTAGLLSRQRTRSQSSTASIPTNNHRRTSNI